MPNFADAFDKFATELGIKKDDERFKKILAEFGSEAAAEITGDPLDFMGRFLLTHSAAKSNPAIERHYSEALKVTKGNIFKEAMGTVETAVKLWAKDNTDDAFAAEISSLMDKTDVKVSEKFAEVFKKVSERSKAASGATGKEKEQIQLLEKSLAEAKSKMDAEIKTLTEKHGAEVGNYQKKILATDLRNYISSKKELNTDLLEFNTIMDIRVNRILNSYHVAKNEKGEFELFMPDDHSKKAFDATGATVSIDSVIDKEIGPEMLKKKQQTTTPPIKTESGGQGGSGAETREKKLHSARVAEAIRIANGD